MKHHLNLTEKQALVTRYTGGETVSAICSLLPVWIHWERSRESRPIP